MYNLSLTACSFHLRKTNSHGNTKVYNINSSIDIFSEKFGEKHFDSALNMFSSFFEKYKSLIKDDSRQSSFKCEYNESNFIETDKYKMIYSKIYSGSYGSSSDIIDGETLKTKYKKLSSDIDIRPFYLMVVFPKDNNKTSVQKGLFLFQNIGPYGIKTITTTLMQDFFSSNYNITLKCHTIAPSLFIKKVIRQDNIKKLVMIKNIKSSDISDNLGFGYGSEVREISKLKFNRTLGQKLMDKIQYVSGNKCNLFEFEDQTYDNLKIVVDIGGRPRKINLHNLDNLSIIENIPENIQLPDGHPNLPELINHFKKVTDEYLDEMVLQITT